MSDLLYIDLLIENGNFVLNPQAGISLFLSLKQLTLRAVSGALARSAFSHTQRHP